MARLKLEKTKDPQVFLVKNGKDSALFRFIRHGKAVALSAEEPEPDQRINERLCEMSDPQLRKLMEKAS